MVLYIDETEHEEYFIVSGLLAKSDQEVNSAYKKFKKNARNYPLTNKTREKLFLEFKSVLIDKQFQKIKFQLLKQLKEIDGAILYSCHVKKQPHMKEILKESVYITLLSNIVNSIDEDVDIVFDEFKNKKFEETILCTFADFENVQSIEPQDSQRIPGLQFADNICSVIRLHLTGSDENDYYSYISNMIRHV